MVKTSPFTRRTILVNGRLAMRTEKLRLAREGVTGVQVMAVEHMAERLAGGFLRMVPALVLKEIIAEVLPKTDIGELEPIKSLPGMISATASTLMKLWLSGEDVEAMNHPRIKAILELEQAVTAVLPAHYRRPNDIIQMAIDRASFAPAIFGSITLKGMTDLHPIWRPLMIEIASNVDIEWDAGPREVSPWLKGFVRTKTSAAANPDIIPVECATARHEVIESVRWVRQLMADGVRPQDIAVATVSTAAYDDHMVSVANDADIGIHFVHGVSAVHREEGQTAAALADILLRGLSQKRVRRLVSLIGVEKGILEGLPADWGDELNQDAALTELSRWENVITDRQELANYKHILQPFLALLAKGTDSAAEIGAAILTGKALEIWNRALVEGPADALDRTILMQKVEDGEDPLSSPCFMSAENLAACPRPYARLIGLTSRSWPRQAGEDALIPDYVIPSRQLDPMPISEMDRRDYNTIKATTEKALVLSWARRDAEGRQLGISKLVSVAEQKKKTVLIRTKPPKFAMSEADRLFARNHEYALLPSAVAAAEAWANWRCDEITKHDGLIAAHHPRIIAVFEQYQSATSIQRLLRDPMGFVWKYALGFNLPEYEDHPLTADPRQFGNIVHKILKQTVERLDKKGGFTNQSREIVSRTIDEQAQYVALRIEMSKPIPPTLIWYQMMERAADFAKAALFCEIPVLNGQKSFAEVPFGRARDWHQNEYPWDPNEEVLVPGTKIKLQGEIDRFDIEDAGSITRVMDYKTGKMPKNINKIVINHGLEVQRGIYGFVVKTLLGKEIKVEAGLLYPAGNVFAPLEDIDETMTLIAEGVATSQDLLVNGVAVPGVGAKDAFNDMKFALPANSTSNYLLRKHQLFRDSVGDLTEIWDHE